MSISVRNAIKTCQKAMELLARIRPEKITSDNILEIEERMKKIAQVLAEHEARSLWLQTREGQAILRRIDSQALKVADVLEKFIKEGQGIESSYEVENRVRSARRVRTKTLEKNLKKLEDYVEELKSEIEKRTYYIT
jgi:predicted RND superfamily exporter protein